MQDESSERRQSVFAVFKKVAVFLEETSRSEDECFFDLFVNDQPEGKLALASYYPPKLGMDDSHLLIWNAQRIYSFKRSNRMMQRFVLDDEVHVAFSLGDHWCLICEVSVALWSPDTGDVIASCDHDEVLLKSWWSEGELIVEDFQKRRFRVEIDLAQPAIGLRPVSNG